MVRPVEPDPPTPLPRAKEGVRQTTATPEQLGHTPLSGEEDRPGRRKQKPGKAPEPDTVSLDGSAPPAQPADPGTKERRSSDRQKHVDLRG